MMGLRSPGASNGPKAGRDPSAWVGRSDLARSDPSKRLPDRLMRVLMAEPCGGPFLFRLLHGLEHFLQALCPEPLLVF